MNMKRFTGRTSREALALVRQTFGRDAVVMSTRNCPEGVEVLAMAPESLQHLEKFSASAAGADSTQRGVLHDGAIARTDGPVEQDVERLAMSTLSFQDYVRERMLKRRRSELAGQGDGEAAAAPTDRVLPAAAAAMIPAATPKVTQREGAARPAPRAPVPAAVTDPETRYLRDLHDEALASSPASLTVGACSARHSTMERMSRMCTPSSSSSCSTRCRVAMPTILGTTSSISLGASLVTCSTSA